MSEITDIPMPNTLSKAEITDILLREEYGYLPEKPDSVKASLVSEDDFFCAGKATLKKIMLECPVHGTDFYFPIYYTKNNLKDNCPCIIQINFRDNVPDKYQPTEELIDRGYSVISFYYEDVTKDNDDFTDGLAGICYPDGRTDTDCGKIGLWAWALMRATDYAMELEELDKSRISVAGHSRLGKTALLAGMLDERVYCAFSNDSGCSGAAISRNKQGERISDIWESFSYWFAKSYEKYVNNEDKLPFDQHYLIAGNVPHRVFVTSASEDLWADPESEYRACELAQEYYRLQGLQTDLYAMPKVGQAVNKGHIGYAIRNGKHYFSRTDWLNFLDYLEGSES